MTAELQAAMARYEEARGRYQRAVLGSLNGVSNGQAIRRAIQEFQLANAELRRLTSPSEAEEVVSQRALAAEKRAEERPSLTPLDFFWRLLKVG